MRLPVIKINIDIAKEEVRHQVVKHLGEDSNNITEFVNDYIKQFDWEKAIAEKLDEAFEEIVVNSVKHMKYELAYDIGQVIKEQMKLQINQRKEKDAEV